MPNGINTFLTGLRIVGEVSKWSEKALADGKVTLAEAVDLAEKIGSALGVRLELDLPGVAVLETETDLEKPEEEPEKEKRSWE
ncbi:hypothetical protein LCGC14_0867590 [marine sediment metagenome]|uniref:Uncharacterized protein n=1 Tax=marine sediment metagenome TaxID=412755 RepID=A0A0F9RQ71_9ZZZZ|nr:hypothetical protein [Desulfobacterales bacterium]